MTDDTHGSSPHDPESDYGHEQASGEGEAWQGGAPVDDDFKDPAHEVHAGEHEEGATVLEEHEGMPQDMHEAAETNETAEPAKKNRGILLPAVITVGGVALLGVLAYWQFGDSLHGEQQTMAIASQSIQSKSPAGGEAPAAKLAATENQAAAVTPKTDMAPVTNVEPPSSAAALPTQPAAIAQPLSPPTPSPATPANAPAAVPAIPPATTGTVTANAGETEARIATLSAHVDDLQKSLAEATQQLGQINAKLSGPQQSTLAIEDRINGIEQKLMQMEHTATAPAIAAPSVLPGSASAIEIPKTTSGAMHKSHRKAAHHTTTVSHTAKSTKATHWVLRAASPNEAWVAKDANTTELQPVQVGDSLAGVGKITAIREEGGAWVIQGSKGVIR